MTIRAVMLPFGGAIVGVGTAELFRKPGSSGLGLGLVGAVTGILLGFGVNALLPRTIEIVAGRRYRVSSPFPSDQDKPTVFGGLAEAGAVVTSLGPGKLVYELTAQHTKTLSLGADAFDFVEPGTGRDVKLRIDNVEEVAA